MVFSKIISTIIFVIIFFMSFHLCVGRDTHIQESFQAIDTMSNTPILGSHPRLHMNRDRLNQIKALKDFGNPVWTRFHKWVKNKPTYSDISGGILTSYLLAYLVTEESQYFDWAWDLMKAKIYKNGVSRSGGFNTLIGIYKDSHSAAFMGGHLIAQIAMLYDWGYDQLNSNQKKDLINWLNEANKYNYLNNQAKLYFRNDGAISTYGLAAGVYATLGENEEAENQLKWFQDKWQEHMEALDIMGMGGAMAEGNAYGAATAGSLILTANLVYYASGNDLFLRHPWFKQRLVYDAFAAYPGTIGGAGSPIKWGWPGIIKEQASIGGDGRRGYSFAQLPLRQNGLILSRRFAGTEEANIWNWVYRQPDVDKMVFSANSFIDVLYYSPKTTLIKPTSLSHFDPSLGYVYIRSDWDSDDATWIAFWAGPHLDTHQHLDQGSFMIFKRRDLAPKTGHMDRNNVFSEHHLSYYTRTISSNGILVGDSYEIYRNFIAGYGCNKNGKGTALIPPDNSEGVCIPNDGGQRTMSPSGLAVHDAKEFYAKQDIFDVAKVTFFEDTGDYVSLAADLTNAYNNPRYSTPGNKPKVNRVHRWLVYLRKPDLIVIGDIVESTDPDFEKKWLLHSLDQLQVGGDTEIIQPGEEIHTNVNEARIVVDDTQPSDKDQPSSDMRKGYAALLVKTLLPDKFRYRKVGGREPTETVHKDIYKPDSYGFNKGHFHRHIKDFWVKDFSEGIIPNHKSFNWIPESPNESASAAYATIFRGGYGRWRLEIEPVVPEVTDYFLNVLKPTVDPHERLPLMEKIETVDIFGTMISANKKIYTIIFQKDDERIQPPIVRTERIPD